jgi:hypothetical protein
MNFGPFESYAPPGVYPTTIFGQDAASQAEGQRLPVIVAPGAEQLEVSDFELFRGSSSQADNPVYRDDLTNQITGANTNFQLTYFPVVIGDGNGTITNDPNNVTVTRILAGSDEEEETPVNVLSLNGTTGEIILAEIPQVGDTLYATYFFNRTDTQIVDEDLSTQADGTDTIFKTRHKPVVRGDNSGIVTNDVSNITVTINGSPVTPTALNGTDGLITLQPAPLSTDTVLVTYYTNQFPNTSDLLPQEVAEVVRVGLIPGRTDFQEDIDYTVKGDRIYWGTTGFVEEGNTNPATTPFDEEYISVTALDNQRLNYPLPVLGDGSTTTFTLPTTPVDGTNQDVPTDDPAEITVRVGPDIATAVSNPAETVLTLNSTTRQFELNTAPTEGYFILVTYYENLTFDDQFTLQPTVLGDPDPAVPVGTYSIKNSLDQDLMDLLEDAGSHSVADPGFGGEGVTWNGTPNDLQPGFAPASQPENITLEFQSTSRYQASSSRLAVDGNRTGNATTGVGGDFVAASGSIDGVAATGALTATAQLGGMDGNRIRVIIADPGPSNVTGGGPGVPDVAVSGQYITVTPNTDVAGISTDTVSDASSAITGTPAAVALVAPGTTGVGTDLLAFGTMQLAGGNPQNGHLDVTYIDNVTGSRWTILSPSTFSYAALDTLALENTDTFDVRTAQHRSIAGFLTLVDTTLGTSVNNTGLVETFDKSGREPDIGAFYYISYLFDKTFDENGVGQFRIHSKLRNVIAEYGDRDITSPATLAWDLCSRNGSPLVGILQVKKAPNSQNATTETYSKAFEELRKPQRGNPNIKGIIPITTNEDVFDDLKNHVEVMSNQRNRKNRRAYIGTPIGNSIAQTRSLSFAMNSERIQIANHDGCIIEVLDTLGNAVERLVDGSYYAAAFAGLDLSPTFDVAESMINRQIIGIKRPRVILDDIEMNELAVAGVTVFEFRDPILEVRHDLTTRPENILTSTPQVIKISDFVEDEAQAALKQFIGKKGLDDRLGEIEDAYATVLRAAKKQGIIKDLRNIEAFFDEIDPRVIQVQAEFLPVFPIVWIPVTNRIRVS